MARINVYVVSDKVKQCQNGEDERLCGKRQIISKWQAVKFMWYATMSDNVKMARMKVNVLSNNVNQFQNGEDESLCGKRQCQNGEDESLCVERQCQTMS